MEVINAIGRRVVVSQVRVRHFALLSLVHL